MAFHDLATKAIRKKLEADLSKKRYNPARTRHTRKAPPGTVLALKPSPALQIKPTTTVAEAAQMMAAKREDCVLVTDNEDRIAGIFTAKDLAFRVVGAGVKARDVTISGIMTRNPLCARTDTSATDALDLMVRKGFRHLPVMDENKDISGVLDITKCFYDAMEKLERAYSSSRKLYDALEGVHSEFGSNQPEPIIQYVEALRQKMSGPTLASILSGNPPTTISVRTTVKDAAAIMRENRTTALLVHDQGSVTDGHYLNLPVMSERGEIVGMVDVLQLTYATLEQINTIQTSEDEGPAWNKFWLSTDQENDSVFSNSQDTPISTSGEQFSRSRQRSLLAPETPKHFVENDNSIAPNESASRSGGDFSSMEFERNNSRCDATPFPFKFKSPSGRVHRVQVSPIAGVAELVRLVSEKLGADINAVGGEAVILQGVLVGGVALSYLDNEGDTVSITNDNDLADAILVAKKFGDDKVDLIVHGPDNVSSQAKRSCSTDASEPARDDLAVEQTRADSSTIEGKLRGNLLWSFDEMPLGTILPAAAMLIFGGVIAGVMIGSRLLANR
ncbi:hypothetical protein KEM55_004126 [Ascosphaera atra]|nr:hypothetical protein KEM55_004126 [Ascosphaera atra]